MKLTEDKMVLIPLVIESVESAFGYSWKKIRFLNINGMVNKCEWWIYCTNVNFSSDSEIKLWDEPILRLKYLSSLSVFHAAYHDTGDLDAARVAVALNEVGEAINRT